MTEKDYFETKRMITSVLNTTCVCVNVNQCTSYKNMYALCKDAYIQCIWIWYYEDCAGVDKIGVVYQSTNRKLSSLNAEQVPVTSLPLVLINSKMELKQVCWFLAAGEFTRFSLVIHAFFPNHWLSRGKWRKF